MSLKSWQEAGSICCRDRERGVRWEVELGSKPLVAGVMRALRFCVMESSMALRDVRRKSRSITVEKQNWGVSFGCTGTEGSLIISGRRRGGGGGGGFPTASESELWRLVHRIFATLSSGGYWKSLCILRLWCSVVISRVADRCWSLPLRSMFGYRPILLHAIWSRQA